MIRPTYWSRLANEYIASKKLHVASESELKAHLLSRGCRLYEKGSVPAGEQRWETALCHAMRAIGWKLYQRDSVRIYKRPEVLAKSGRPPVEHVPGSYRIVAPKPIEAPTPRLLKTGPEVYVTRRSPRASMIGGAA